MATKLLYGNFRDGSMRLLARHNGKEIKLNRVESYEKMKEILEQEFPGVFQLPEKSVCQPKPKKNKGKKS